MKNPAADSYFSDGCMRCPLGATPECKVHRWSDIMSYLRMLLIDCGLTEERKWGVACYTYQQQNIVILGVTKDYCNLGFFKGALMSNTDQLLTAPGENSQATRQLRFDNLNATVDLEGTIKAYVFEAMEIEKAGLKVQFKSIDEYAIPKELLEVFKKDPEYQGAFKALTPGRQRGYLLHFEQPKQESTRYSRIEKARSAVLLGRGIQDDYKDRIKK
jgi:uncharacterized protein YdeI (YjbR/CyaY-like superfamily)